MTEIAIEQGLVAAFAAAVKPWTSKPVGKLFRQAAPSLALVSVLVAALTWMAYHSTSRTAELETAVRSQLSEVKETDAVLDALILQSRIGTFEDYDPLTLHYQQLSEQVLAVRMRVQGLPLPLDSVVSLETILSDKGEVLNQYKAQHAIFRNSLHYLPEAVSNLRSALAQERAGKKVNELAGNALSLALQFAISGDSAQAGELLKLTAALSRLTALPEAGMDANRVLVNHLQTILRQKNIETQLFRTFSVLKLREQVDQVGNEMNAHFLAAQQRADRYRRGLVVFAAALLMVLAVMALRLFRSFQAIQHANATLEQNVAIRTQVLNQTLHQLQEQGAQLIHQEKMASLGQMVAGIAHEINTPLGYLRSGLQSAQASVPMFEQLRQSVDDLVLTMTSEQATQEELEREISMLHSLAVLIEEDGIIEEIDELLKNGLFGVNQISDIVANLKDFSRLDSKSSVSFNTSDCIESTLKIATNVVKKVKINQQLEEVPSLEGFPSQINQVLLNLITNACHATEQREQGEVTIRQAFDTLAHMITIEVADNGAGISQTVMDKIFDPFFTTKDVGKGTGLGLHISRKIIEAHHGKITVASQEGVGSAFTIWLPVTAA